MLPLQRLITYYIHLLPNSNPINAKPYWYPHNQKVELEKQAQTMLDTNLIRISHSPFSPPVLLVKKKNGRWRCYVDYLALKVITIKGRFPMSTIDELFDELGSAS